MPRSRRMRRLIRWLLVGGLATAVSLPIAASAAMPAVRATKSDVQAASSAAEAVISGNGTAAASSGVAQPPAIGTHAHAAALIDVESGRLLYSQRGDEPNKIASLTKIMTAIVAIEQGELSDTVTTSTRAAGKEGSSIYLQAGEEMTLQHMLYGLMLRSGNDAATAIAEHVGGSEEGFVLLMNEKAQWLGLENSHFMNPHGLDHKDHYASANDLAKLAAYALKNPVFQDIVKTKIKSVPNPHAEWDYTWLNKNKMLSMYEGADGVKTGYTKQAFRTLVSSATRNGQQLAAVTLNDGDDWADHRKLLDWGFAHYPLVTAVEYGQRLNGHPYAVSRSLRYPFAEGERELLRTKLVLRAATSTEHRLGEAARLEVYLGEEQIANLPLEPLPPPRPDSGVSAPQDKNSKETMATVGAAAGTAGAGGDASGGAAGAPERSLQASFWRVLRALF